MTTSIFYAIRPRKIEEAVCVSKIPNPQPHPTPCLDSSAAPNATSPRANGFDNYREETDETEEETDETEDEDDVSKYRERCQQRILLYYSPEQQTITTGMNRIYFPLSEMRTMLRELQFYDNMYCTHYKLTEQAQEEMIAVFEAICRDR